MPGEQTPDPRTMIATLVDDLADAPPGAALVLDDYHEIQSREVHEAVSYLVENLPDECRPGHRRPEPIRRYRSPGSGAAVASARSVAPICGSRLTKSPSTSDPW